MLDRSEIEGDPFSDLIRLVGARPTISGGFIAGGDWALRFPAPDALKFFAVIKGGCWLKMEGEDDPIGIEQGDVILITAQRAFVLGSDLSTPPLDAVALFATSRTRPPNSASRKSASRSAATFSSTL